MSQVDDAFFFAEPLSPDDRLRLIARLWASLPPGHWAAPSPSQLADVERRLAAHAAGQTADVPWEIVHQMLASQEAAKMGRIYSAPRRFDLATILIVTAAFAIVLGGLGSFNVSPIVSGYVAAFIACVGTGQALLFGGRRPRLASVLTGMVAYCLCMLSLPLASRQFERIGFGEVIMLVLMASVVYGGVLGYLAGVLVGGVFLVADVIRRRLLKLPGGETAGTEPGRVTPHATNVPSGPGPTSP